MTVAGGGEVRSRAVIIATGASYRRLGIPSLDALTGTGVFYGAATSEAKAMKDREVFVVGGANSAGQAAVHLARYAARVTMLVRDQADFTWIGVSSRKVPQDMPPGRALRNQTGIETQVAMLAPDASSHGQAAALAAIGEQATARDAGLALQQRPFRVDILPGRIGFAAAWQIRLTKDCEAAQQLAEIVTFGADQQRAVVCAGNPDARSPASAAG